MIALKGRDHVLRPCPTVNLLREEHDEVVVRFGELAVQPDPDLPPVPQLPHAIDPLRVVQLRLTGDLQVLDVVGVVGLEVEGEAWRPVQLVPVVEVAVEVPQRPVRQDRRAARVARGREVAVDLRLRRVERRSGRLRFDQNHRLTVPHQRVVDFFGLLGPKVRRVLGYHLPRVVAVVPQHVLQHRHDEAHLRRLLGRAVRRPLADRRRDPLHPFLHVRQHLRRSPSMRFASGSSACARRGRRRLLAGPEYLRPPRGRDVGGHELALVRVELRPLHWVPPGRSCYQKVPAAGDRLRAAATGPTSGTR